MQSYDISQHFHDCNAFLSLAVEPCAGDDGRPWCRPIDARRAMVHCKVGSSRSAATVLAFLVHIGFSLRDAAKTVRNRREVCPNMTFLALLVQHERAVLSRQGNGQDGEMIRLS